MIDTLYARNKFPDIQGVVVNWINPAFHYKGPNKYQTVEKDEHKWKVRFITTSGKPMLVLTLLGSVFENHHNLQTVLNNSYNHVHKL